MKGGTTFMEWWIIFIGVKDFFYQVRNIFYLKSGTTFDEICGNIEYYYEVRNLFDPVRVLFMLCSEGHFYEVRYYFLSNERLFLT